MGNIITKDPDTTINWTSNKDKKINQSLTPDARKLLGLLPDKLEESSEKPNSLEPIKVSGLHPVIIDQLESKPRSLTQNRQADVITTPSMSSGLIDPKPFVQNIQSVSKQIGGNRMLDTADLSDTSPFISSDMYKNLINANNNIQLGGAPVKNVDAHLKNVDDSSTSSTSSSGDETDKKKKKSKNNESDKTTESVEVTDASDNSNLSYVSSSAHTGGGSSSEDIVSDASNNSNKSTEESIEVPKIHDSNKSTEESIEVPEIAEENESDISKVHESSKIPDSSKMHDSEVIGYSANSPEPNEATPVSSPKKSKKKDAKKSKDDSSSSSSSSVESIPKVSVEEEDSIENKNSNLPPSEINTSAIEMVSAS